jgi:hypothetical protein
MRLLNHMSLVSRSKHRQFFHYGVKFSGLTIGRGGDISFRMYDKTIEIRETHKEHWRSAWGDYDTSKPVYRAEYQVKRPYLSSREINTWPEALSAFAAIWQDLSSNWLRIVHPSTTDSNQTRWEQVPFWKELSASLGSDIRPVKKTKALPNIKTDKHAFTSLLSGLLSFAASRGIHTLSDLLTEYFSSATQYHGGDDAFIRYCKHKLSHHKYEQHKASHMRHLFFTTNQPQLPSEISHLGTIPL